MLSKLFTDKCRQSITDAPTIDGCKNEMLVAKQSPTHSDAKCHHSDSIYHTAYKLAFFALVYKRREHRYSLSQKQNRKQNDD